MKKITLALLFAGCQLAFSQPILNLADFPTTYSSSGFLITVPGFNNDPSGANVVWDYSTVTFTTNQLSYNIVPVNSTPYAGPFPTANFCEKFQYNGGDAHYAYYNLTNQSLELIGRADAALTTSYTVDPATIYTFPYTFSTEFTDTVWPFGSPTPPEPIIRIYDGYGTLIMPNATYTNVIRQKVIPGAAGIYYEWIGTNPYHLILSGNFEGTINSSVRYYSDAALSNSQQEIGKFQLYPNPTTEYFSVKTSLVAEKIIIAVYDVLGKQMLQNNDYVSDTAISLKEFANGIYIVKVTDANHIFLHTEKIIKK